MLKLFLSNFQVGVKTKIPKQVESFGISQCIRIFHLFSG